MSLYVNLVVIYPFIYSHIKIEHQSVDSQTWNFREVEVSVDSASRVKQDGSRWRSASNWIWSHRSTENSSKHAEQAEKELEELSWYRARMQGTIFIRIIVFY